MPTIDTSTIEGFDSMTADQKVEALLKAEIPEKVDMSLYVAKDTADKYATEVAELKKQLKGKMTDDEKAKAEAEAKQTEMEQKYNELLRKSTVAEHTAKFLALGYEEKLARDTAEALFDGDMDKVFANQQKAKEALEKAVKANLVKQDPKPEGAGDNGKGEETDAMKLAQSIGKAKAEGLKASNNILSQFTIGVK